MDSKSCAVDNPDATSHGPAYTPAQCCAHVAANKFAYWTAFLDPKSCALTATLSITDCTAFVASECRALASALDDSNECAYWDSASKPPAQLGSNAFALDGACVLPFLCAFCFERANLRVYIVLAVCS
jgi:hypothetical protein